MPIYEYECQNCRGIFEIVQKFSDKPKRTCESCGGRLKKLISTAAFHLKGSGWYATDYAAKQKTEDKKGEKLGSDKPDKPDKKEAEKPVTSK